MITDLIGKQFGKLIVKEKIRRDDGRVWWKCLCDCGNFITERNDRMINGTRQACKRCQYSKIQIKRIKKAITRDYYMNYDETE